MATLNKSYSWMGKKVNYEEYLALWIDAKQKFKQAKHMANVKAADNSEVGIIAGTTVAQKTILKTDDWFSWNEAASEFAQMQLKKKAGSNPLTITVGADPDPDTIEVPIPQPQMKSINQKKDLFDKLNSFKYYCIEQKEEIPSLIVDMLAFLETMTSMSDDQYNQAWEAGYNAGVADAKYTLKAKDLYHPE